MKENSVLLIEQPTQPALISRQGQGGGRIFKKSEKFYTLQLQSNYAGV
jgi:hypothetical protein